MASYYRPPRAKKFASQKPAKKSSWESASSWYDSLVGPMGHYYHQKVIFPNLLKMFGQKKDQKMKLLDLACGQGVLARQLPPSFSYVGIEISPSLVKSAQQNFAKKTQQRFFVGDVTKPLPIKETDFDYATIILALQNIQDPKAAITNAYRHLKKGARLIIVLNHPCFRIPRQSGWGVDEQNKQQYRRINRYMTELEIPIITRPSDEDSAKVISLHHPLSSFSQWLFEAGFAILKMDEWLSDKVSEGGAAKMENLARGEFPLFLTITAIKL